MASSTSRTSILTLVLLSLSALAASPGESARPDREPLRRRTEDRLSSASPPEISRRLMPTQAAVMERWKTSFEKPGLGRPWEELQDGHSAAMESRRFDLTRRRLSANSEKVGSTASSRGEGRVVTWVWESEAPADGIVDARYIETSTFNLRGNLLTRVFDIDDTVDGIPEERWIETSTYDTHGNLVHWVRGVDTSVDGTVDFGNSTIKVYDPRDNLLEERYEYFALAGGSFNGRLTHALLYDRQGNPTQERWEQDDFADGTIDSRETRDNEYDPRGNLVRQTSDFQHLADGTVDYRSLGTLINEYDQRGSHLRQVREFDQLADGTIDEREVQTFLFDSAGNLLQQVLEMDFHADGTIDYRAVYTRTYDEQRNPVSENSEFTDSEGTSRLITTSEYDQRGNLVRQEVEEVAVNGGRDLLTSTLEYDERGRLVQKVEESDGDGAAEPDGTIEVRITTTNEYDGLGNLARERIDEDKLATPGIDYRDTVTYRYSGSQRPLREGRAGRGAGAPGTAPVVPLP